MEEMKNAIGNRLYARVNKKRILAKTTSEEEGWWVLEVEADVSDHCSSRRFSSVRRIHILYIYVLNTAHSPLLLHSPSSTAIASCLSTTPSGICSR